MIDYLHRLLGYSITGDVGAQILPFLYGSGKNENPCCWTSSSSSSATTPTSLHLDS